jgi:hypothetical protein
MVESKCSLERRGTTGRQIAANAGNAKRRRDDVGIVGLDIEIRDQRIQGE